MWKSHVSVLSGKAGLHRLRSAAGRSGHQRTSSIGAGRHPTCQEAIPARNRTGYPPHSRRCLIVRDRQFRELLNRRARAMSAARYPSYANRRDVSEFQVRCVTLALHPADDDQTDYIYLQQCCHDESRNADPNTDFRRIPPANLQKRHGTSAICFSYKLGACRVEEATK